MHLLHKHSSQNVGPIFIARLFLICSDHITYSLVLYDTCQINCKQTYNRRIKSGFLYFCHFVVRGGAVIIIECFLKEKNWGVDHHQESQGTNEIKKIGRSTAIKRLGAVWILRWHKRGHFRPPPPLCERHLKKGPLTWMTWARKVCCFTKRNKRDQCQKRSINE